MAELDRDADVFGEGFVPCEGVADLRGELLTALWWWQPVGRQRREDAADDCVPRAPKEVSV